jgi:hypothetical protein
LLPCSDPPPLCFGSTLQTYSTENWGLLAFDSQRLLFNPQREGAYGKLRCATIVCHETAHQWLGNMVTPATYVRAPCVSVSLGYHVAPVGRELRLWWEEARRQHVLVTRAWHRIHLCQAFHTMIVLSLSAVGPASY